LNIVFNRLLFCCAACALSPPGRKDMQLSFGSMGALGGARPSKATLVPLPFNSPSKKPPAAPPGGLPIPLGDQGGAQQSGILASRGHLTQM